MRIQRSFADYFRAKRNHFDLVMFDIDGTLVCGNHVLPGAQAIIEQLKQEGFPFALLTNDGTRSAKQKADLLQDMGLAIEENAIISCADALVSYVRRHDYKGHYVFVMGSLGEPCYAKLAKLDTTRSPTELIDCDGVIVGEGNYEWESTFNAVINFFIRKQEAFLIVPNPDTYWPTHGGQINIGAGAKARFIANVLREYGVIIEPAYLGKPSSTIFRHAINHLCDHYALVSMPPPERIIHVGDSLTSDIQGANAMNFTSVLVLTGVTNKGHLKRLNSSSSNQPHLICEML